MRDGRVQEVLEQVKRPLVAVPEDLSPADPAAAHARGGAHRADAAAVALGVAVVLAIELAGEAAAGSFRSSVETLAGSGDFEVTATGGVPAGVLARLALLPYALRLRPRIEDYAVIADTNRVRSVHRSGHAGGLRRRIGGSAGAAEFQRGDSIWTGRDAGCQTGRPSAPDRQRPGRGVHRAGHDRDRRATPS